MTVCETLGGVASAARGTQQCLLLARNGRGGAFTACLLSGAQRKISARIGRALQAESAEWQRLVLLFCIRPLVEQIAPGHHGYPRASDLILR
jgi:hypothetical protein